MQVAGVDIHVNHPVLHLGATDWVPLTLSLGTSPAAGCETHVAVRVRPQHGLVRVRLFAPPLEPDPPPFPQIFSGPLLLPDGRFAVADVEQLTRFVHRAGDPGYYAVRVTADSPGPEATRIDVTISPTGA